MFGLWGEIGAEKNPWKHENVLHKGEATAAAMTTSFR